jgi:hypothetical protein
VGDLIDDLVGVRDDGVQLFEGLKRLVVIPEALVDKSEVIDSLNTVSLDSNGLEEELLGTVVVLINEEAVTLIDKSL